MRILVTGCNGQLGSEIRKISPEFSDYEFVFLSKKELNISDKKNVLSFFKENSFYALINCAAYTNVNKAEKDIKTAELVNNFGIKNLAIVCRRYSIKLIHISTDYVFDGSKKSPYIETDITNPINAYGTSKLNGELSMISVNPKNSIIIRTSWLYSNYSKNFVKSILNHSKDNNSIDIISDQFGSPTNAYNLSLCILSILKEIKNNTVEIFHYSDSGIASWFEFASEIIKLHNLRININKINSDQFKSKIRRPKFSVMSSVKIQKKFKIKIYNWKKSLAFFLNNV